MSPRNAFITMVVRNKVADILQQRESPSRAPVRLEVSLNSPMEQDGRPVERGDTIAEPKRTGDESNARMDLDAALASLPEKLRSLWNLRVQGLTFTEIAVRSGVSRPTICDRWKQLCVHLRTTLGAYFEET
jgi:RNA polymerase sigma factor (sigma-70 family)